MVFHINSCYRVFLLLLLAIFDKFLSHFLSIQVAPDELFQTLGISAKWATNAIRDSILFHPCLRKLVNESCGTFLKGQKLGQSIDAGGDHGPELLKLSRSYRYSFSKSSCLLIIAKGTVDLSFIVFMQFCLQVHHKSLPEQSLWVDWEVKWCWWQAKLLLLHQCIGQNWINLAFVWDIVCWCCAWWVSFLLVTVILDSVINF